MCSSHIFENASHIFLTKISDGGVFCIVIIHITNV